MFTHDKDKCCYCFYLFEVEERTVWSTDNPRRRHFILVCPKSPESTAHRKLMRDKEKAWLR